MQLIRHRAYARAGLVGNPSDGYFGKTIALSVYDFWAEVTLYEWERLELILSQEDRSRFDSLDELVHDVALHGYYGGVRLVKATVKKFAEFCHAQGHRLHNRNFSIRYQTNIPRQVGLAGSSAIIVATLRCLMEFYGVEIPLRVQPSLALAVETEELGIAAGLQDRVVQVYGGLVYMDFTRQSLERFCGLDCGRYERLDPALLPTLYLAYSTARSGPTEVIHNRLRERFLSGERAVHEAMQRLAELTDEARQALLRRDHARLGQLMDENFEIRRSICRLPEAQVEMVLRARQAGATAKFAGSGGAIIGTFPDESVFARLKHEMEQIGCRVIRPTLPPLTAEHTEG